MRRGTSTGKEEKDWHQVVLLLLLLLLDSCMGCKMIGAREPQITTVPKWGWIGRDLSVFLVRSTVLVGEYRADVVFGQRYCDLHGNLYWVIYIFYWNYWVAAVTPPPPPPPPAGGV